LGCLVDWECEDERLLLAAQAASLWLGEFPGNGQAEPGASSPGEGDEPIEGALLGAGRQSWAVVADRDDELAVPGGHPYPTTVAACRRALSSRLPIDSDVASGSRSTRCGMPG
jgi:hypothetical protein